MTEEKEFDLNCSAKGLGKLYPILKDAHGNIIDGFHRQNVDPDWPVVKVDSVDSPQKLELARLATNFCRRTLPKAEIENRLAFLVGKCGMKAEEIAKATGISLPTIYRHLPAQFKDEKKAEAGRIGGEVSGAIKREQTVKTQDTAQLVECENCHVATSTPKQWQNHQFCDNCYAKALKNPEAMSGHFHYLERAKNGQVPPIEKPKPIESWTDRKAHMQPGVSKMDMAMATLLSENKQLREAGWHVETQKSYAVLVLTSDVTLLQGNREIAVFFDHVKVHTDPEKDEANRELLRLRCGVETATLQYEDGTKPQELLAEILEQIGVET